MYKQRVNKISVRATENHNEYHRQYYWITVKGLDKAPIHQMKEGGKYYKKGEEK